VLLALDTSTSQAGIALYDGRVRTELIWQAGRDHGRHLMPAVEEALRRIGLRPADLTAVAAARGPGSFTGLRVGLGVAQGLALALGIPMYGVGSLEVLAYGLPPLDRPVRAVLEAGRGRVATALFEPTAEGYRQAEDMQGVDLDGLVRLVPERCAVVGDLDAEARARLEALGAGIWVAPPALAVRRPAVLAERAWQAFQEGRLPRPEDREPIYLTRS
jgi:tRNA threonylcarbamoyladenosine biosynthesis protein TsaB